MRMLRFLALAWILVLSCLAASSAEAATLCGFTCPAGQHAQRFSFNRSCCASPTSTSCAPTSNNEVTCAANTPPSFGQCGTACPSGFHAFQLSSTSNCCKCINCSGCDLSFRNQAFCIANTGTQFEACGGCPAGYTVASRSFRFDCCGNVLSSTCNGLTTNSVSCRKI